MSAFSVWLVAGAVAAALAFLAGPLGTWASQIFRPKHGRRPLI